ncbi:hypothetical protein [Streptomyces sp. NBC_01766]|uniref:hypothetical protein n=1 Tax=Streptomyces sp. NBC_01766 TaxID=2975936 RepID=UPI002DDBABEF|nr:hypothetical protein [Streptomyces sp. NBC_01766]WSC21543.1 hypothetical protein OIE60_18710 [Streptomyces sp. NBC_01766]
MISHTHVPRLLPWTGPAGKPAYLLDGGAGRISRIADTIERDQLGMADDLLDDAAEALADRTATRESQHWKDNNSDNVSTSIKFSGCSLSNGGTSGTFKYATLQLKKERAKLPDPVVARNNNYCGTSSFGDVASGSYYFNYSGLNGTDQTSWHLSVSSVVVKY